jgi:hypothetical protein
VRIVVDVPKLRSGSRLLAYVSATAGNVLVVVAVWAAAGFGKGSGCAAVNATTAAIRSTRA